VARLRGCRRVVCSTTVPVSPRHRSANRIRRGEGGRAGHRHAGEVSPYLPSRAHVTRSPTRSAVEDVTRRRDDWRASSGTRRSVGGEPRGCSRREGSTTSPGQQRNVRQPHTSEAGGEQVTATPVDVPRSTTVTCHRAALRSAPSAVVCEASHRYAAPLASIVGNAKEASWRDARFVAAVDCSTRSGQPDNVPTNGTFGVVVERLRRNQSRDWWSRSKSRCGGAGCVLASCRSS